MEEEKSIFLEDIAPFESHSLFFPREFIFIVSA